MRLPTGIEAITVNKPNIKEIMCDPDNLYQGYLKAVAGSKWKESTQRFMRNYLSEIFSIERDLRSMSYHTQPHGVFETHERGKIRTISSLVTRDRVVRHVLCDEVLNPAIRPKLIHDNGASLTGLGISFSRRRFEQHLHRGFELYGPNCSIMFGDFSKFYDNIVHDLAKEMMLELFDHDPYLEWLLDVIFSDFELDVGYMSEEEYLAQGDILFNSHNHHLLTKELPPETFDGTKLLHKSVGIGDQISQTIGIFYPHRIDNYVKTVRSQRFYGRYMDDWYIIGPDKSELWDVLGGIREEAKSLGIFVNERKTGIQKLSNTITYLQVRYQFTKSGHLVRRMNPKRVGAMRSKIRKLAPKVYSGEVPVDAVDGMFRSWMGSFHSLLSKEVRTGLIGLYEDLYFCKITVEKGKLKIRRSE
jgi:hypothetical protein